MVAEERVAPRRREGGCPKESEVIGVFIENFLAIN